MKELLAEALTMDERIESLSCELRNLLEERAELSRKFWEIDEEDHAPDGSILSDDDLQDMANDVAKVEETFDKDNWSPEAY